MQKVLDDLMISVLLYDSNKEDHLKHLKINLEEIWKAVLKLELSKMCFLKKHLQYLRHLILGKGIYPHGGSCMTVQSCTSN